MERNLSLYTLYGVWGDDFHKSLQILEKNFIIFFLTFNFLMLFLLHKTSLQGIKKSLF